MAQGQATKVKKKKKSVLKRAVQARQRAVVNRANRTRVRTLMRRLRTAITAAKNDTAPIELLVENQDYFKTCKVDYHGGERYPHLERDPSKPDLLSLVIRSQTAQASPAK